MLVDVGSFSGGRGMGACGGGGGGVGVAVGVWVGAGSGWRLGIWLAVGCLGVGVWVEVGTLEMGEGWIGVEKVRVGIGGGGK